jgi:DNA-binding CsgD family transcriptional regulator
MEDEAAMDRVVASWQRAAVEPSRWHEAVADAGRWLGAPSATLFTPVQDASDRWLAVHSGSDPAMVQSYVSHWIDEDPWFLGMARQGVTHAAGVASIGRRYVEPGALRRTGFYQDFARQAGIHDTVSLVLTDAQDPIAPETRLSFHRPHGTDDFDEGDCRRLRAVWPQLRQALQTYWLLRRARDPLTQVGLTLDALPHPAWVLRADAAVDHANAAATALVRRAGGVTQSGATLRQVGTLDQPQLVRALRMAGGRPPPLTTALRIDGHLHRAAVHLTPIADNPAYASAWPHAVALLMVDLPQPGQSDAWLRLFARMHGLTAAETRVLAHLLQGRGVPEVAGSLGVACSTVRTQVRMLLEKTGSQRQSDLVRRVLEG